MNTSLQVEAVAVQYGHRHALSDVNITVPPGSVLAVTGASGSGKTTLLWVMAGLLAPTSGTVRLGGKDIQVREDAVTEGVHLIPQGNGLASVLTAHENVAVAMLAAGVDAAEATRRADAALDQLGVTAQAAQLAEELSGGQRQRVAIARGLALRAPVLLADEITSDLDVENRDLVLDLLRQEAKRGACVVFATNDTEAAATCDIVVHLADGRVEATPSG
ncbi:ABC transporter ATP-binding protein [Stackebrandtia nassauensis]|uniref:ABC transporter related protein n=1 Tax=Stackebrandtia nassauensis (strain DSM 44728 / CIP 108903 / NRRL B-16338 / NBRC 102104 / LLR-40K-21) TaxID=446470 RepID=D3PV39_STANL|nr:ATP-binding cassette domain-containing protein [Stackebrandtia nassauensis]ADD41092.1 ABC transporter related protein [Stackebrandtia nassauensis DSM 44728]